jgi:hypothetical protein
MNYSYKEWKEVSPTRKKNLKKHHFNQWNFFYAVAEQDIVKPEGDLKWTRKESFLCRCFRSNKRFWVNAINVNASVKKGEVFICGQLEHLCGVEKATGVKTFERLQSRTYEQKVRAYLTQRELKKQRRLYSWYENEKNLIQQESIRNVQDMNESMSLINLPENKKVEYVIKAKDKRIKTKYGEENNLYSNNFTILTSPFDMAKERICLTEKDLKRWGFLNHDEVMAHNPKLPLYIIKGEFSEFICEKQDFGLVVNHNEKIEISYVNKWEEKELELNKKMIAINRWLKKALSKIREDVWKSHPDLIRA